MNFEYRVFVTPKPNTEKNFTHNRVNNRPCILHVFDVGYPCWFTYLTNENESHMVRTSCIKNITYREDNSIFIETVNSFYKFERI